MPRLALALTATPRSAPAPSATGIAIRSGISASDQSPMVASQGQNVLAARSEPHEEQRKARFKLSQDSRALQCGQRADMNDLNVGRAATALPHRATVRRNRSNLVVTLSCFLVQSVFGPH